MNEKLTLQIRHRIYALCALVTLTFGLGVWQNVYLTDLNFEQVKELSSSSHKEQSLINERSDLFARNQMESLVSRSKTIVGEIPLSSTGHYYLG